LCKHIKRHLQEANIKIGDGDTTIKVDEEICKKAEAFLDTDEVKSKIQERIEVGRKKLMDNINIELQKDEEEKIQESHQKILEEVELHLEDVHVKYDDIIAKE
jgi:arginine/glutamate-rich protein 1